jgi:hypothetical protein
MKIMKFIFRLLFIILLSSCITTKGLINNSKITPIEFTKGNIEGTYTNKNKLWNRLSNFNIYTTSENDSIANTFVKLELIDRTKLKATLIKRDSILENKIFEGKIVDNYFSVKRDLYLLPIPFFYFRDESKIIIGINDKNNLVINGRRDDGYVFLIFFGGGINQASFEFEKIKD